MLRRTPLRRSTKPLKRTGIKRSTKPIASVSKKRQKRNREVRAVRVGLIELVGTCEVCGDVHRTRQPELAMLCVHEIACGATRGKALDQRYAVLVLCSYCNLYVVTNKANWPEARQLAALLASRPEDFNLTAYNTLKGFGLYRITFEDVRCFLT